MHDEQLEQVGTEEMGDNTTLTSKYITENVCVQFWKKKPDLTTLANWAEKPF